MSLSQSKVQITDPRANGGLVFYGIRELTDNVKLISETFDNRHVSEGFRIIKTKRGHEIIVDKEDYEYLLGSAWELNTNGYPTCTKKRKKVSMARELVICPPGMVVDHINGNRLDQRKKNLRVCSVTENNRNQSIRKGRRFKGATYIKSMRKWRAIVRIQKQSFVSYHETELEAAKSYNELAKKHYGQFARLNVFDAKGFSFGEHRYWPKINFQTRNKGERR
jgi:hypothetical protein